MPLFLDPKQPLSTCSAANCQGCPLQSYVVCHFGGKDLARFMGIALPPFVLGGIGITRLNGWLLLPWIVLSLGFFALVEIRVMCSHCPHYAEPGSGLLRCWANYGIPKLWRYRPGPMTTGEKVTFFTGVGLIGGYPLAVLIASGQWLLLFLFALVLVGMGVYMARVMCARCMNFACPFNRVKKSVREAFFARNPLIARAWEGENKL